MYRCRSSSFSSFRASQYSFFWVFFCTYSCGKLRRRDCDSNRRDLKRTSGRLSGRDRGDSHDWSGARWARRLTFDGDALAGPLLLEGGEALPLADADDVLLEVKLLGVEAQQAEPQLSHRLRVGRRLREEPVLRRQSNNQSGCGLRQRGGVHRGTYQVVGVVAEEGVPAVHHPLRDGRTVEDLERPNALV